MECYNSDTNLKINYIICINDNINYKGQWFNGKWSRKKSRLDFRIGRVMKMLQKKMA